MYIPTKMWVMAFGKKRPPVSDEAGWSICTAASVCCASVLQPRSTHNPGEEVFLRHVAEEECRTRQAINDRRDDHVGDGW